MTDTPARTSKQTSAEATSSGKATKRVHATTPPSDPRQLKLKRVKLIKSVVPPPSGDKTTPKNRVEETNPKVTLERVNVPRATFAHKSLVQIPRAFRVTTDMALIANWIS